MTFIDLFAGIGGFRAGLEQAGMTCVGWCEKDKFAKKSYKAIHNISEQEWFRDDITTVTNGEIPRADGWTAGFPCSDLSSSGKRLGLAGERSGLFFEIIRLVEGKNPEDRPKWIIIENVKGLISQKRDFTEVLYQLSEVGYNCEWDCINSKAYIPQHRERIYIVGHIRAECCGKVFPVGGTNAQAPNQIIGGSQGDRLYDPQGLSVTIKSQCGGGAAKTGLYCITVNRKNGVLGEIATAHTIQASDWRGLNRNQTQNAVLDGCRIRRLTPLETFRLQGFTNEQFHRARAVNSDNQLYRQAGNSITVPVVRDIGLKLTQIYGGG